MCTPDLQKRSQLVPNYLSCTGIILASWTYCEISSSLPSSGTWRIWQRQSLRMVKIRPMSREPLQCHSGKMMITESQQSHSTESLYITAEEVRLIRFRPRKDVLIGKIAFQACNHLVICAPVWHRQDLAGFCTYFLDIDFGYLSRMSGTQCVIMPTFDSVACHYPWKNSRFGRKWTECIDKEWEGSRKPSGVREQGASCPQPKCSSPNDYGGRFWLTRCVNLTAKPKTPLISFDPFHFFLIGSSWLSQSLPQSFPQKIKCPCLLSDIKIGADRRNRLCVLSGTLCISAYHLWISFEFIVLFKFAKS